MKKVFTTFAFMLLALGAMAQTAVEDSVVTEKAVFVDNLKKAPVIKSLDAKVAGGEAILKAIIGQNKGKVLLIDFWATWCGPCRMAMKKIDEIKAGLVAKGCEFVYVTGESSPLEKWNAMIADIEGVHYRLTNKQWGELCQSLSLRGIPSYMIINKDGSTAYDNFKTGGYPGSEMLQNEAEVALTK